MTGIVVSADGNGADGSKNEDVLVTSDIRSAVVASSSSDARSNTRLATVAVETGTPKLMPATAAAAATATAIMNNTDPEQKAQKMPSISPVQHLLKQQLNHQLQLNANLTDAQIQQAVLTSIK